MQFFKKDKFFGYFYWLYGPALSGLINLLKYLIIVAFEFFSIPLLGRYLFAPWKRDVVRPANPSLSQLWQAFLMNFVSRFIGFSVRTITILTGLTTTLFFILAAGSVILLYFIIPLPTGILALGLFFGMKLHLKFSPETDYFIAALPFASAIILYIAFLFTSSKNNPFKESLTMLKFRLKAEQKVDITDYLDYAAKLILEKSNGWRVFQNLIFQERKVRFILYKAGFSPEVFVHLPLLEINFPDKLLSNALEIALKMGHRQIETGDLFLALFLIHPALPVFFEKFGLKYEDLENILYWQTSYWKVLEPPKIYHDPSQLRFTGGIGKEWQAGYTPTLSQLSSDITKAIKSYPDIVHFQAHKNEISTVEQILGRSAKNNILLVGEPGTGKKALVLGVAKEILFGKTLKSLAYKKVVELDLNSLLSAAQTPQQSQKLLVTVLNEACSAGNIILFIDGLERILGGTEEKLGTVNATQLLIPYLQRSDLQLITTCDFRSYHKYIEKNAALEANIEKVEVKEPNDNETLLILQEVTPALEARNKVLTTYPALKEIIKQSKKYLSSQFPEKAIDLLDEALVFVATKTTDHILLASHIDQLISAKTHILIGEIKKEEKERLLNLEKILHQRLINQNEAVNAVAESLRRARAGIAKENKPFGSFLFLGPTGVGKTETAKALAEAYFTSEKNMIRLDMSEYQQIPDIEKIIGSENYEGLLTSQVREKPFSLILLDEIEKAHPNILNLFLQILDEGKAKDYSGQSVNFQNTIIIGTSNASAEFIREKIAQGISVNSFKQDLIELLLQKGIFKPEFLNRFDAVVAFRPLTQEELVGVVDILTGRLNERLKDRDIQIELDQTAKVKLAQLGFDPQFGARALVRTMSEKVENLVAQKILKEELKRGQTLQITGNML